MPGRWEAYEELQRYPLDASRRERLLTEALECSVTWVDDSGWPLGVVHWFVWDRGRFFVTVGTRRTRVAALRARPQSCVIVSGAGTALGPNLSVSAVTRATVHADEDLLRWFAGALSVKAYGDHPELAERFEQMLLETERVVIELEPFRFVSHDGAKMGAAAQEGAP
ncbi:MAG: hypothetical protein M0Z63_04705 [Actinomycetota bacterium]|jgi:hypothetical protein|nr:hypothetical protein [Actinomycetota bacterium]MDA8279712.1 hypothetical protein [Actinomycetota bacterium]